ncbi:hypothetical protein HN014_17150 [Aquimarina sp. TRL1]|uniref:hypothetical protein n=1 Tax=Aquimarina sp. (strain TRL1) TaxID=2736252 RepID=UPI00158E694F|nr:hypothetical protein [Aquimarina sp. TRL1]QKX06567.1 hypothetical protein HN014_17150 [Aquimarina sp. TRL1]
MISKVILEAMLIVGITTMNAQEDRGCFGVKTGLNLSSIHDDYTDNIKTRVSILLRLI